MIDESMIPLKPRRRSRKIGILLLITIFWSSVLYFLIGFETPLIIPITCGAFELALLAALIHSTLSLFNPRPTVEITPGEIHLKTNVAVRWSIGGKAERIQTLKISLRCQHVLTTHGSDGDSKVIKNPLYEVELLNTEHQKDIGGGTFEFIIPANQPISRPGKRDGIEWSLLFHGDIAHWPDMKDELPFIVHPE